MAESLGWRWEFGIQVPLLLLCMVASLAVMPNDLGLRKESAKGNVWAAIQEFDTKGFCLIAICITSLILALVRISESTSLAYAAYMLITVQNLGGSILRCKFYQPFVKVDPAIKAC